MSEIKNPGEYQWETIRTVDQKVDGLLVGHLIKRACQRGMEEYVELMLEAGLSTGEILTTVTDAIHNECRKTRKYPSDLTSDVVKIGSLAGEIVDVLICVDYIRHIAGIFQESIRAMRDKKLVILRRRAEEGECVMVDGNVYKSSAGRVRS